MNAGRQGVGERIAANSAVVLLVVTCLALPAFLGLLASAGIAYGGWRTL